MTDEQKRISNHNNRLARKILNPPKNFVMHHKDTTLKYTDIDRYIEWRVEDLVILSRAEHLKVHQSETPYRKGKTNSEEHRKKLSELCKGRPPTNKGVKMTDEQRLKCSLSHKGIKPSEETKKKLSEAIRGKHWKNVDGKRVYY